MSQPKKSTERHEKEKVDRGHINPSVDMMSNICTGNAVS